MFARPRLALSLVILTGMQAAQAARAAPPQAPEQRDPARAVGARGLFHAHYVAQPTPVPLLALHSWTVTITDAAGVPVDGAQLTLMGGMPAHGHGLPTRPVVRPLGGGRYRVDGLRFNMPGHWSVAIRVSTPAATDTVTFPLELP
jgi:hypothetical protein